MPGTTVERATELTDEVLAAFERLLPQLSTTAGLDPVLLQQMLDHDATVLLLARRDGTIVGTTTLVTYPIPTGWRAHIDDVVVDSAARGHGVSEALLHVALEEARACGARTVDLTSRPSRESAIRLYQRMGFTARDSHLYRYQPDLPSGPPDPAATAYRRSGRP